MDYSTDINPSRSFCSRNAIKLQPWVLWLKHNKTWSATQAVRFRLCLPVVLVMGGRRIILALAVCCRRMCALPLQIYDKKKKKKEKIQKQRLQPSEWFITQHLKPIIKKKQNEWPWEENLSLSLQNDNSLTGAGLLFFIRQVMNLPQCPPPPHPL